MTYWIVYETFVWHGQMCGETQLWGPYSGDPNYSFAGISRPSESWLMIPPDNWECE